ncbi:MAG: protein translocase subunit SecF [Propionibacteriales bacterium]|nr:protein translocase subunit SecF [Propionibacteriales bacterium]
MSRIGSFGNRLYSGEISVDFVSKRRRRRWYTMSAVFLVVAILGLGFRGLDFGVEFTGGVEFRAKVADNEAAVEVMRDAVVGSGLENEPIVTSSGNDEVRIQTEELTAAQSQQLERVLRDAGAADVTSNLVGPSWGEQIANRALTGLAVFLGLVMLFIAAYFREWKMSLAAAAALGHDVLITVGVYALSGFEVTPATVTGVLTILGYSLYDTVVVFDKVRENTRGIAASSRRTFSEGANLAVNQTLVRSINTTAAALLPVGALLYVGAFQLGSGPLKDLALALFVGMAAGAYSSIFLATPLLVQLKEREPRIQEQIRRVEARRGDAPMPATLHDADAAAGVVSTRRQQRPMTVGTAKRSQPQRQARSKRGSRSRPGKGKNR